MTAADYDLFVIGGGSGGVRAARVAAAHGAKVAIAESDRFGGTCVIRGCVPKKLLVYASRFRDDFEDAAGFGWSVEGARFDWPRLIANKDAEIRRLEAVYQSLLVKSGVEIVEDRAVLAGQGKVRFGRGGAAASARHVLIATGGSATIPSDIDFGGPAGNRAGNVITSREVFELAELPRSIVIIGGGYIAVEFASIMAGLGSRVTLLIRGEQVLRGFDGELRRGLAEALGARGIEIVANVRATGVESNAGGVRVRLVDGRTLEAGKLLMATGRHPNTSGLGLECAGVETGANGAVRVDDDFRTNVAGIYAVGDVTDRVNLTPVAIREGHAFADSVFGGKPTRVDHGLIPTAVFTTPEIGTVGLSEEAARDRVGGIDVYKSRFRPMRNVLAGREERTLMKLVVEQSSGRVLGCHVLGPDAAEIVQMAAIALGMGATKADFDATMALHPSAAEELVTMRERWTGVI